ncbi:hypothetical protein DPMN_163316 [Dreissena polymorpha]|uniref:Uncharacterized protein n=1 Tax=Dreissena polymorpha TaxID=45954 RepID=A0A9D4EVJ0_DREPO|nr:hypothetical protein DPMN_163316 [Dreissena polymorpha]
MNLKPRNISRMEGVIDFKCRLIRDNLLFIGITEVVDTEHPSIGLSINASDDTQETSGKPPDASDDVLHAAMGRN